jgi:hypothetical protein
LNQSSGSLNQSLNNETLGNLLLNKSTSNLNHQNHHNHSPRSGGASLNKSFCSKCSNSYLDLLKDELSRRIEVQVANSNSNHSLDYSTRKFINPNRLIDEINNQISFANTEKFDSLYNKILMNHKYSTVNNTDLLNRLRSRFLL